MILAPACYGRATEAQFLEEYLTRAVDGDQQLILLEGDDGIGKTALLLSFAARHRGRGRKARFFYFSAQEGERYDPVRHAALAATDQRHYARFGGRRQGKELARSLWTEWLAAIPIVGELLNAIVQTFQAIRRRGAPTLLLPEASVDEEIESLITAARGKPLVLLMDDLDQADPGAVDRLEKLICVADEDARILIVAAYRTPQPGMPPPPVKRLLKTLPEENELFVHLKLEGLPMIDVGQWLEARFRKASIPEAFIRNLASVTGGHPGAIEDAISDLQIRGGIRKRLGGWEFDPSVTIQVGGGERGPDLDLERFPPRIIEVVAAASLFGVEFDGGAVANLLEADELEVEDRLAEAVHLGLLESAGEEMLPSGDIVSRFRFASPHLVPVIRERMEADHRAELIGRLQETNLTG
jgi:hypothetical protein